jgi:hypothetical protein
VRVRNNELDELEACEQKEREEEEEKEETRRETQLPVSTSNMSAPANGLSVYSAINLPNLFDNLDFVILFINYNLLDSF